MNRRTTGRQQQQPQRTPQPSIRSSQVFSQQPTREQTQYQQMNAKKQLQQQQLQQQQLQQQQMKNYQNEYVDEYGDKESVGTITKMTVAQAITLITLRLGSIETKLMNNEITHGHGNFDGESLSNFSERLDALETKLNLSSSTDYKQQIDHLTQAMIQSKNMTNTLVKENKELKSQLAVLKKEMTDSKQLIEMVRNIAVSNESKIFEMLNISNDYQMDEQIEMKLENVDENENEFNLSDSEHGIIETDIRETLVKNNDENDDTLQMTEIDNVQN